MASTIGHPARPGQITAAGLAHPETPAKALERALLAALRSSIAGRAAVLHGSRSAVYRQAQVRGEHPITLRDLAELVLASPLATVQALRVLLSAARHVAMPADPAAIGRPVAAIRASLEASTRLVSALLLALEDGRIADDERSGLLDSIAAQQRALCAADASLRSAA